MVTYDATAPAAHERTAGPGNPRLAHAYPDNTNVALCGATGPVHPTRGAAQHCPLCLELARPSFIQR